MASVPQFGNQGATDVCSAAGIQLMSGKRFKLSQLKNAIRNSVVSLEGAKSKDEFLSKALLTASLIKATCDAFLEMAGSIGDAAGIKGADAIAKGYSAGAAVATTGTQAMLGQQADWVGTASSVGKLAVSKTSWGDSAKSLAELQLLKVDIINAAVQKDSAKVLQISFLEVAPKIATMSLDALGHAAKSKWTGAVTSVANAGANYSKALDDAFNARLNDIDDGRSKDEMLNEARRQYTLVSAKIDEIDALMNQCGMRLGLR
jgi:hypothetical protein